MPCSILVVFGIGLMLLLNLSSINSMVALLVARSRRDAGRHGFDLALHP